MASARAAESLIRRLIDGSLSKSRRETGRHCRVYGIAPGRLHVYRSRPRCATIHEIGSVREGDGAAEERDRVGDIVVVVLVVGEGAEPDGGRMEVGYEGAAGSAALIKLAEDNEPVCRLACLAV